MLRDGLVARVLVHLGIRGLDRDQDGLFEAYAAWCSHVAFDNLHKRVWFAERHGPMPGDDPTSFFEMWLAHDTGGTCWGSSGALHALFSALGFDVRRATGTMMLNDEPIPIAQRAHTTYAGWATRPRSYPACPTTK
jgi:arylamine N-acetyltransferase